MPRHKAKKAAPPIVRRYDTTQYETRSGGPCDCPELIPGLDACMCPVCKVVWNRPRRSDPRPAPDLEIKTTAPPAPPQAPPKELPRQMTRQTPAPPKLKPSKAIAPEGLPEFTYAITLHRPWAYAVAHLDKDLENRNWPNFMKANEWLAVHAGKTYDKDGADWIEHTFDLQLPPPDEQPTGIIAIAQFVGNITESASPWRNSDRYAWQFQDIRPLIDVVDCKGKQGLWKPEDRVKKEVYAALQVPF